MAPRTVAAFFVWLVLAPGLAWAQPTDDCICGCSVPPPEPQSIVELRAVQAAAVATGLAAWVFTTATASQQHQYMPFVDSMPVVGGIDSAVHNQSRDAPLMLFTASVQVMSILVAVVAGVELAEERERWWHLTVGGNGQGGAVMLGGSF
jgi:hypothetical protein